MDDINYKIKEYELEVLNDYFNDSDSKRIATFRNNLSVLINQLSIDGMCSTPDFMLATMLTNDLVNYMNTKRMSEKWKK